MLGCYVYIPSSAVKVGRPCPQLPLGSRSNNVFLICGVPLRLCGFLGHRGLGPKPPPAPLPQGFGRVRGGKDCPSPPDPSFLVSVPFSQQRIMQKRWQRKGRWGEKGGRLEAGSGEWGSTGPVRKEPPRSPPCRAESWGPGEGAGWPSRAAPPSARALPPRPPAGNVLFPLLPPRARGQGGPGGGSPLLPAQVRAELEPPPQPPLTHAAPGLAGCGCGTG